MRARRFGYLQLDASGITFDFGLWSCVVPWQRIGRVEVSWHMIRLFAEGLPTLAIDLPGQRELALRRMSAVDDFGGTPFIIVPFKYRLPRPRFSRSSSGTARPSHATSPTRWRGRSPVTFGSYGNICRLAERLILRGRY